MIDGRPIREWPIATLRGAIGFVPQDPFLFSETLGENIALGVTRSRPEKVSSTAAVIASIDAEIRDFPQKYETMVGERGITLSGGQKQRTTLARAILREPENFDSGRRALQRRYRYRRKNPARIRKDVTRGRTTILVSHRCSTVRHADEIIVLREGRIVERGTHDELIAHSGYYYDLYQKQLLEEELGARMSDFREEETLGKAYDSHLTRRLLGLHAALQSAGVFRAHPDARRHSARSRRPHLFHIAHRQYIVPGSTRTPRTIFLRRHSRFTASASSR